MLAVSACHHPKDHGFGHGIHPCLGAPLARKVAQAVLRRLAQSTERLLLAVVTHPPLPRPSGSRPVPSSVAARSWWSAAR
ncbi:MAG: hypothetical protein GEV04_22985 [Actinophytocola sp.]|nr:hypothetical protein [Actinophytocola sp.]